jgi:hypothetical protein
MLFSFRIPSHLSALLLYYHVGLDFLITLTFCLWALAYACITTPQSFYDDCSPVTLFTHAHTFPAHNDLFAK